MAVYTMPTSDELARWVATRDVGDLVDWQGIGSGIENSNFFVTTDDAGAKRDFVLTIFERMSPDALLYDLALMKHLAEHDVPCPAPMPDRDGALCTDLAGKPAALVTRVPGRSVARPEAVHCEVIGRALARLHRAASTYDADRDNPRGLAWWIETAGSVRSHLDIERRSLLDDEIAWQAMRWSETARHLPRGAIHADLFRDNALFVEGTDGAIELGGIIDFYFAGRDAWLLDLAICVNDWCIDLDGGRIDEPRLVALVAAYHDVRPLSDDERAAWPLVLRAAALRFWLSRLDDLHRPRPAALLTPHDPTHFERVLRARRDVGCSNAALARALAH